MRIFGTAVGLLVSVAIVAGLVWFNRYSPTAQKEVREAKRAAENERRRRILADDAQARLPALPKEGEEAGQPEPPPPVSKEGPYPKAVTSERTFDFGTMAHDEERKHVFTIKNEGTVPLLLTKGATNCTCTISNLPKRELAPSETVEIIVSWTPRDLDNNFRKVARIQTSDPENTDIPFLVVGKVVQEFMVSPSHEWNFGNVAENAPAEIVSMISSALVDKFQIRSVESSHPLLKSTATPLKEDQLKQFGAKSGYEFRSTLAPGIPVGPFDHKLKIHTDLPGDKVIDISVNAFRAGPLRFLPARGGSWASEKMVLNMGRFLATQGKTVTLPLFVQGLKEDFKLVEIAPNPTFLKVSVSDDTSEELSRRAYQLKFEVPPNQPITSKTLASPGRVVLKTNHPDAAEIVIEVLFVSF